MALSGRAAHPAAPFPSPEAAPQRRSAARQGHNNRRTKETENHAGEPSPRSRRGRRAAARAHRAPLALTQRGGDSRAALRLPCRARLHNNVWARAEGFDPARPTLLLNSHHDTVRPAGGYTRDPYTPTVEGDRLYGLGSNDAGASVVCLTETFLAWRQRPLPFNLVLALSAEEECMGEHGMRALLPALGRIDMALVGEPTRMQAAVGERGLVVLDCTARGRSGHAARGEGVNALYIALDDIVRLRTLRFERCSELLGPVGIAVTQIEAGTQHNVIPDRCRFVVDVRTTDAYTNEETVELLRRELRSEAVPRSTRVRASALAAEHPLCRAARAAGCTTFVSPTTSDMALMPFPSLKMGPGDSARSHTADEYVRLPELEAGITGYDTFIEALRREAEHLG